MIRDRHYSATSATPSEGTLLLNAKVVCTALVTLVCLWVLVASRHHTALHHDMAEQAVWAHGWQWAYPKHPPLPTWLFLLALQVLPLVPGTLYALSALCISVTGVCTYAAGRALLGPRGGLCVALLWGLQQPFGWRAWLYNHNTVLVMVMALAVMCTVYATQSPGRRWWWAAGAAAGLAMCTKLQAVLPLSGLLVALWGSGQLSTPQARRHLLQAIGVAVLVSAVPLWGVLSGHTSVMAYATAQLDSGARWGPLHRLGHFFVTASRMLAPALLVGLIWAALARRGGSAPERLHTIAQRAWVTGLLWWPTALLLLFGVMGKTVLHAQWGVQALQFFALAMVVWWGTRFERVPVRLLMAPVLLVQVVALAMAMSTGSGKLHARGAVQGYPSAELARRVQADWDRAAGPCVLRHVSAPFFEGGQLSAYLPSHPSVLEDDNPDKSPWVDLNEARQVGSVVLAYSPLQLPADGWHEPTMQLTPPPSVEGVHTVYWAIRRPAGSCTARSPN